MKKKNIYKFISLILAVFLGVNMLNGSVQRVNADTVRLYGVQKIVDDLSEENKTFDVLEIVPDNAFASMGFLVSGYENSIPEKVLFALNSVGERYSAVSSLYSSITNVSGFSSYNELLYRNDEYSVVDHTKSDGSTSYYESRTGYFAEPSELGLSDDLANYVFDNRLDVYFSIDSISRDDTVIYSAADEENSVSLYDGYVPAVNDVVKFSVLAMDTNSTHHENDLLSTKNVLLKLVHATDDVTSYDDIEGIAIKVPYDNTTNLAVYDFSYTLTEADADKPFVAIAALGTVGEADYREYASYNGYKFGYTHSIEETTTTIETVSYNYQIYADLNVDSVETVNKVDSGEVDEEGNVVYKTITNVAEHILQLGDIVHLSYALSSAENSVTDDITITKFEDFDNVGVSLYNTETGDTLIDNILVIDGNVSIGVHTSSKYVFLPDDTELLLEVGQLCQSGVQVEFNSQYETDVEVENTEQVEVTGKLIREGGKVQIGKSMYDHYYDEANGMYIWVDDDENGTTIPNLQVGKIYYNIEFNDVTTNIFANDVLQLSLDNKTDLADRIHVHSYTPKQLEEAMTSGEIALSNMDLIYVSNSSAINYGMTFNVDGETKPVVPAYVRFDSYFDANDEGYTNDLAWETVYSIYSEVVNTGMPIVIDRSVILDPSATEDNNVCRLAYLLQLYTDSSANHTQDIFLGASEDWANKSAGVLAADASNYGIYGRILNNVYVNSSRNLVHSELLAEMYNNDKTATSAWASTAANEIVYGLSTVIDEIENDTFYNALNTDDLVSEYVPDSTGNGQCISITPVTLIKYILNYASRRVTLYKDSIRVLDLEPTKYSTLNAEKIRGWLGSDADRILDITIDQMTTYEFVGKLNNLVESYDMIYIGSCIGNGTSQGSMYQSGTTTKYNDTQMNGLIYSHVGDRIRFSHKFTGLQTYENVSGNIYTRFSGNDITREKMEDLLAYANAGYPVVIDDKFFDNKGNINTYYVDNSSYMYELMNSIATGTIYLDIDKATYEANPTKYPDATPIYSEAIHTNIGLSGAISSAANYGSHNGLLHYINDGDRKDDNYWHNDGSGSTTFTLTYRWPSVQNSIDEIYIFYRWDDTFKVPNSVQLKYSNNNQNYQNITYTSEIVTDVKDTNQVVYHYTFAPINARYIQLTFTNQNNLKVGINEYEVYQNLPSELIGYRYKVSENKELGNVMSSTEANGRLTKYINMPRLNLVMVKTPTEYSSTLNADGAITSMQFLSPVDATAENPIYNLDFEFEFSNTAEQTGEDLTYTAKLYVDINADGQYTSNEQLDHLVVTSNDPMYSDSVPNETTLKSGVRYAIRRQLPQGYVGLIPWKLTISLNRADGLESTVYASEFGYTAIQNKTKVNIKVLQIKAADGALDLTSKNPFPTLIKNLEDTMNYHLAITPTTIAGLKNTFTNGKYGTGVNFYKQYLKDFDMLIFGFSDMYYDIDNIEIINGIKEYINSGKSVLFSHDITSFVNDNTNSNLSAGEKAWSYYINQNIRPLVGMDRYGITDTNLTELKTKTANYKITDELKNKIIVDYDLASKYTERGTTTMPSTPTDSYYEVQGFTNTLLDFFKRQNTYDGNYSTVKSSPNQTTTKITQVNKGQITTFPYNLNLDEMPSSSVESSNVSSTSGSYLMENRTKLEVASTHYQYYQLDFNFDTNNDRHNDLVVWYCLAGDHYDAVPNDVRNNYYIYSVGNITYTGMGHSANVSSAANVTRAEAQLFINTIIAAYNSSVKASNVTFVTEGTTDKLDYVYRTFDDVDITANNEFITLETDNEPLSYIISDYNITSGVKSFESKYYYEINESEYHEGESGYVKLADSNVFLKELRSTGENPELRYLSAVDEEGNLIIENNHEVKVQISNDWINSMLSGQDSVRVYILETTTISYPGTNKDEDVRESSTYITFKRRSLFNLD